MHSTGNIVRFAVVSCLIALVGCAATEPPVAEGEALGSTASALTLSSTVYCEATPAAAILQQKRATAVLKYILGGPRPSFPNTLLCAAAGYNADTVRSLIQAGEISSTAAGDGGGLKSMAVAPRTTVCGLSAVGVKFEFWMDGWFNDAASDLASSLAYCYGNGITPYVLMDGSGMGFGYTTTVFDPTPALLTSNSVDQVASAASAQSVASGDPMTVYRAPGLNATSAKLGLPGGAACAPTGTGTIASGTVVDGIIMTKLGNQRCILPNQTWSGAL